MPTSQPRSCRDTRAADDPMQQQPVAETPRQRDDQRTLPAHGMQRERAEADGDVQDFRSVSFVWCIVRRQKD